MKPRLGYIDGLRGLAALYVTGCHAYLTYADSHTTDLLPGCHWLAYGRSAVAVFIVVSGYCLMLPVLRAGELGRGFLWRRARRILPPYYAALLLSLTLLVALPGLNDPVQNQWSVGALAPATIGSHLLLIHNYWPNQQHAIDYPMWSLASEWQIYLLFPWLVMVWRRRTMGDAVMLALRITFVLQVLLMCCPGLGDPWPPQFVVLFALGMAAAACRTPRRWGLYSALLGLTYVGVEATLGDWLLRTGHQQVQDLLVGGRQRVCSFIAPQARAWPASWVSQYYYGWGGAPTAYTWCMCRFWPSSSWAYRLGAYHRSRLKHCCWGWEHRWRWRWPTSSIGCLNNHSYRKEHNHAHDGPARNC